MIPSKREIEKALRGVGFSRSMAKQIISSGLPGYKETLSTKELIELGLLETQPLNGDYVGMLMSRADSLLH